MTTDVITENTSAQNATADNLYSGVVDSEIVESSPTGKFGGSTVFAVHKPASDEHVHSVIRFDGLSNISSSAIVSSATLYLEQAFSGSTFSIDLRRLLQAWVEADVTWNRHDGTNDWNTGGAEGAGTDRVSAVESTTEVNSDDNIYHAFDCTSLVQDIIDGTISSDEGFHLERSGAGVASEFKGFKSSEASDGDRPELVVVYTIGGATGKSNPLMGPLGGPLSGAIH